MRQNPEIYDFRDWDDFLQNTLRYHTAKYPNKNLVSDKIATLRSFMSTRVLDYLDAYMRPHPRYNTTVGWDRWVENVRDVLREHDETIGHASTVLGWLSKYKMERVTYLELWNGLDVLVSSGKISSAEQRKLFWDNISWEMQERLVSECRWFNPAHKVWKVLGTPEASEAEQTISDTMKTLALNERVRKATKDVVWRAVVMLSIFIGLVAIVWGTYVFSGDVGAACGVGFFVFFIGFGCVFLPEVGPVDVIKIFLRLRRLKQAQADTKHRGTV